MNSQSNYEASHVVVRTKRIIILADEKNVKQRGGQNENLSYETILGELEYTPYFL